MEFCYIKTPKTAVYLEQIGDNFWEQNKTITYSLWCDDNENGKKRQIKIEKAFNEWEKYINLEFKFIGYYRIADIRITFHMGYSNSMIGTDCLIDLNKPSTNFGWIDKYGNDDDGTLKHEIGHILGLLHEHQHDESNIKWNEELLFKEMQDKGWTMEKINKNIIKQIKHVGLKRDYDKDSIMHYYFDNKFFKNKDIVLKKNIKISKNDIEFARTLYPKKNNTNI